MFCRSCGAPLTENAAFCTQCGSPVQPIEAPVVEAPVVEAPVVEAPVVEAPVVEAPIVEAPVVEAPVVEAPVVEAPVVEAPVYEAPVYEAPVYEAAPTYQVPNYNTAPAMAPQAAAPIVSPKSRTAALILSITLGGFGINRLYLGADGGVSRLIMAILGYLFYIIGCFIWPVLFLALPFLIIVTVGGIKDIIRSAKGTMVDGNGLPVTKW